MDMMFEAYLTHEAGHLEPDDIPHTSGPVWVLGKKYNAIQDLEAIRQDIRSRLWFTYRKGFITIGDSGLTTDKGWGCMLRCGQMVLAQALVSLHLGRDWIWTPEQRNQTYLSILHMFEDSRAATYSIHQIALMGASSEGKQVGQWFGPNTIAQVIKKLAVYDEWSSLEVHVALDNTLVIGDLKRQCGGSGGSWKPLLLLLPLRLGLSEINPVYVEGLKMCFSFKQSLGVIGGKPNHALYFLGCVGEELLFLDPHTTQMAVRTNEKQHTKEKTADCTYHCQFASRTPILDLDPSVAVCFFCRTERDIDSLCQLLQQSLVANQKQPLFEICSERPAHWSSMEDSLICLEGATVSPAADVASLASEDLQRHFDDSDEDFELLG